MIQEFAPAKINLFLDILRRRPDGYHDLGTFFQTVNVGDTLQGESDPSGKITLRYNEPQEYPVDSDLVYRAAVLLKTKFSVGAGALLYLEKKLPLGAGLGGGRSALAEGIGDRLPHLPAVNLPKGAALLVATPLCAVPTKAAYAGCIPSGNARWETYKTSDYVSLRGEFFNKFEEAVFPQFPLIARMKENFLKSGALSALMSGSGASVFAVFGSRERASEVQKALGASARFSAVTDFFPGF